MSDDISAMKGVKTFAAVGAAFAAIVVGATLLLGGPSISDARIHQDRAIVIDGDTIEIADETIRLAGIDSPEFGQVCEDGGHLIPCGREAAYVLRKLIEVATEPVVCAERSASGAARCTVGESDLAENLLEQGMATALPNSSNHYRAVERSAKAVPLGLWKTDFIAPADWRQGRRLPSELAIVREQARATNLPRRIAGVSILPEPVTHGDPCVFRGVETEQSGRMFFGPLDRDYRTVDRPSVSLLQRRRGAERRMASRPPRHGPRALIAKAMTYQGMFEGTRKSSRTGWNASSSHDAEVRSPGANPVRAHKNSFEQSVLFIFGILSIVLGVLMIIPFVVQAVDGGDDVEAFFLSAGISVFFGTALALANRQDTIALSVRETFLLTAVSWLGLSFLAAIPFMLSSVELSLADAWFESVSGLTTTGSTVLAGLDSLPRGILLWRALIQWIGGLGIIVMGVAILPFLRVGGMQLFRTESSDRSEKLFGRVNEIAGAMLFVYIGLSVLCAGMYWLGGMTVFEAVAHAMTTLSTGGYSTSDQSLAHFSNPLVHWSATFFMLAGGLPFVPMARAFTGGPSAVVANSQIRAIVLFLVVIIVFTATWLWARNEMPVSEALRVAAFNIVSVVTTTGYANSDYGSWGPFATGLFFVIMFVGGCTGSTGGGIKIFRFQILGKIVAGHFRTLSFPHAVSVPQYEGRPLNDEVVRSVMIFTAVFVGTVVFLAMVLAAMGLDFMTSFAGAATAVANVGPGLGEVIGPVGNFASLPDLAKWALSFGMLLGRLEFFTLLILLTPRFWHG